MMRFGGLGMVFGALFWVLILFLAVAFGVWLVKYLLARSGSSGSSGSSSTLGQSRGARQILDERYARGEINRDEYEVMKKDLADR